VTRKRKCAERLKTYKVVSAVALSAKQVRGHRAARLRTLICVEG